MTATVSHEPARRLGPHERLEGLCDPGTLQVIRTEVTSARMGERGAPGRRRRRRRRPRGRPPGVRLRAGRQLRRRLAGRAARRHDRAHPRAGRARPRPGRRLHRVRRRAPAGGRRRRWAATAGSSAPTRRCRGACPQISVITGTSAGGGSYSPALTDFVIMTREAAMFLTGPGVVREVMGEDVGAAELGGTGVHERNGVCHCVAEDERRGRRAGARPARLPAPERVEPARAAASPSRPRPRTRARSCPATSARVYDVRDVMDALVDAGRHCSRSRRAGPATSSARSRASRAARSASWPTSRACSAASSTPTRPPRPPASCARATRTGCR